MENQRTENPSTLRVISGEKLDVIEPFPPSQLKRVWGWMRRFKSLAITDETPKGRKEFTGWLYQIAGNARTFGIVDRDDRLKKGKPTLVGIVFYEPFSATNGYLHVATSHAAFGKKLVDEAGRLIVQDMFSTPHPLSPKLLRLSATPPENNWMARKLLDRIGFSLEGTIKDLYSYKNEPVSCALYGLTKRDYLCQLEQLQDQSPQDLDSSVEDQQHPVQLDSLDQSSVPSVEAEINDKLPEVQEPSKEVETLLKPAEQ